MARIPLKSDREKCIGHSHSISVFLEKHLRTLSVRPAPAEEFPKMIDDALPFFFILISLCTWFWRQSEHPSTAFGNRAFFFKVVAFGGVSPTQASGHWSWSGVYRRTHPRWQTDRQGADLQAAQQSDLPRGVAPQGSVVSGRASAHHRAQGDNVHAILATNGRVRGNATRATVAYRRWGKHKSPRASTPLRDPFPGGVLDGRIDFHGFDLVLVSAVD